MKQHVWYIVNKDNLIVTDFEPIGLGLSLCFGVFEVDKVLEQAGAEIRSFRTWQGDIFIYLGEL